MNTFYKFYCRIFQAVFKLAIPVLPYRDVQILKAVSEVPVLLKGKSIDSVLIVTDKVLHEMGLLEPLKSALSENEVKFAIYDETVPNPTIKNVEEARKLYLEAGCKGLIGFGGGSAIDCAKAVGARIVRPKTPVRKMGGILKVICRLPYLVAIPTTAGTGSETTVTTVITDGDTKHKVPISDFCLIPRAAVHDPEMTKSMPKSMTATTGMDALIHAIEAYIGRSTVKSTRADSLETAALVAENIKTAYENGDDTAARANMLRAAFLGGRAFSKSYVGYCHAVAHTLGGKYNIPHGLANAVLIPYVLEAYGEVIHKKLKDMAVAIKISEPSEEPEKAARKFIEWIRETNKAMNIPNKLKGIKEEDIPELSRYAAKEANPVYPVPVLMDAKQLEQFYYDVMEEEV